MHQHLQLLKRLKLSTGKMCIRDSTGAGIRTANYMVNMVELKNWMDPDEEEDE